MLDDVSALKLMVRGAYDLQSLRIQVGLRLCANFRSKLTDVKSASEDDPDKMSEEAKKIIDELKKSYRRLTDGVARSRTIPDRDKFVGDALISTHTELVLVDQYVKIESQEGAQFRQMTSVLDRIPIYRTYLRDQVGVGPAMAGVLITYFDPHKARRISSFWAYSGLDVASDGAGRSRRKEHLVERQYKNKKGQVAKRMSVTYQPFLKTKMAGVLGPSFLRSNSPWREHYDNYKHRIESDPSRIKISVAEWKKKFADLKSENGGDSDASMKALEGYWPPGRVHAASNRYMLKMFLADLWVKWRTLEKLEVTLPYHEAKLGHRHAAE